MHLNLAISYVSYIFKSHEKSLCFVVNHHFSYGFPMVSPWFQAVQRWDFFRRSIVPISADFRHLPRQWGRSWLKTMGYPQNGLNFPAIHSCFLRDLIVDFARSTIHILGDKGGESEVVHPWVKQDTETPSISRTWSINGGISRCLASCLQHLRICSLQPHKPCLNEAWKITFL